VNGQPVAQEQLARTLLDFANGRRNTELTIDSSGMEKWLERTITNIRLAARVAGIETIYVRDRTIPFGPSLAVGLIITLLCWHPIGKEFFFVFFHPWLIFGAAGVCCFLMLACSYLIRVTRMLRH
jgi:hypothetical protein